MIILLAHNSSQAIFLKISFIQFKRRKKGVKVSK